MVALRIDLGVGHSGAGRDDAGELALDEFAGLGRLHLVADGDLDALIEQLLDVAVGGVKGDAGHGHAVAVGQGDAEQLGALFGVLFEDLVEIAEAEHEQRIVRKLGTDLVPLLHHGGEFLLGGHRFVSSNLNQWC